MAIESSGNNSSNEITFWLNRSGFGFRFKFRWLKFSGFLHPNPKPLLYTAD